MYLLNNSYYCTLLSVRTITTDNSGSLPPGVDRVIANTPKKKMALVKDVLDTIHNGWDEYKPMPTKRVFIPKANGKLRPLGIPTIKDRALQATVKLALEPFYEAKFESCSYGFRPGMGCHDAIDKIAGLLLKKQKWILDADIKGCFDNIDHHYLATQIDTHWRPIVKKWLKAGYMIGNDYNSTKRGTPQGGTISPLLANITLDQMETDLIEHLRGIKGWQTKIGRTKVSLVTNRKTGKESKQRISLYTNVVRYADDFVVIHEDQKVIEESKRFIEEWLNIRGLTFSDEKTKIVHSTDGFDFLGHHIKHYKNDHISDIYKSQLLNGTKNEQKRANAEFILRIEPTKDKIKSHYKDISETIWKLKSATPSQLIKVLQPKITGWANYYRTVHSSEAFGKLDMLIWKRLYQWACRRHNKKGKRWVANKYFSYVNGIKWTFVDKSDGKVIKALKGYSKHKERTGSYAKVGYDRSYFDGDTAYWAERLSKGYGNITPSKARMLKKQNGICPLCKSSLTTEDLTEAHHVRPKSEGGKNKYANLILTHRHCHDKWHRENPKNKRVNHSKGTVVDKTSPELQGYLDNGFANAV